MKIKLLATILLSGIFLSANAARPTIHASNLNVTDITCHSLQLNWTNGNGNARLIVGREGAATSWTPTDYSNYAADRFFGKGTDMDGSGNFIVYNGAGTNFVIIDSLKAGKTYYFTIYEHDNSGPLYYTGGAPSIYETVYIVTPNFNTITGDSCEAHNLFTFVNQSKTNIPGITYEFDFGDGNFSSLDSVIHKYINKSGLILVTLKPSAGFGCPNIKCTHSLRIYPKKVGALDLTKFKATQCLNGNYCELDISAVVSPLPKSITYNWNAGDGSPIRTFKKQKYHYSKSGHFFIEVELRTNVNLMQTGCADTLRTEIDILPDPNMQLDIPELKQCLNNNFFTFNNTDSSSASYLWKFGDGQTSAVRNAQHSYANAGSYVLIHTVNGSNGCTVSDTMNIEVLNALNSKFNGLDTAYCPSDYSYTLSPVFKGGKYTGYPISNDQLIPRLPGNYKLTYTITLSNCSDSTSKNFRIRTAPVPSLGKDTLISSSQSVVLDAGTGSSYLWSTSATSRTLTINGSTAPKGTTRYSVIVTDQQGCMGYDTAAVSVDYISNVGKLQLSSTLIYPNPVQNYLSIQMNETGSLEWEIFNCEGKKIMSGDQTTLNPDCSILAAGMYMIEIRNKTGIQQLKFMKL